MFAHEMLLAELESCVDRLNQVDLAAVDPVTVEATTLAMPRVRSKVAAFEAKVYRRFETDGRWALVGALTPAQFVAAKAKVPSSSCRRSFTLARKLEELPGVLVALEVGAITVVHCDKILAVDNPRVHDALIADHVEMVRWARSLPWAAFAARLRDWLEEHDADGPDPGVARRRFDLQQDFDGTWDARGCLDPIGGQIVNGELTRLERLLFEQDWKEARARLGCDPIAGDLRRTGAQRSADALALMAERSATLPEDGRRGRYLFTVLLGEPSFDKTCRLASGQQVRPTHLAPYLGDQAVLEAIKFQGPFRAVEASGQRNFRGMLARAVRATGAECIHDHCDVPVEACEIDHRTPHSKGGETSQDNGDPRCPGHNRAKGDADPTTDVVDDP